MHKWLHQALLISFLVPSFVPFRQNQYTSLDCSYNTHTD